MSKFNYKNIIIISILVLFVLSISAVSAADIDVNNVSDVHSSSTNLTISKVSTSHDVSEISSLNASTNLSSTNDKVNKLLLEDNSSANRSKNNNVNNSNNSSVSEKDFDNIGSIILADNKSAKKSTELFVSDEVLVEGQDGILTAILTDKEAKPLVGKKVIVVIGNLKFSGITKVDGIANIPVSSLKAGIHSARAFFEGNGEYNSSYCDFIINVLPNPYKESSGGSSGHTSHYSGYSSNYYSYSSVQSSNNAVVEAHNGIGLYKTGNPIALLVISLMSLPVLGVRKSEKYRSDKLKYLAILAIALVCILSLSAVGASNLGDEDSISYADVPSDIQTSSHNSPVVSTSASSVSGGNNNINSQDVASNNILYTQNQSSDNILYTNTSSNNAQNLSYNNTLNNNYNIIIDSQNSNLANNHENDTPINVSDVLNSNDNINTINSISVNVGSDSYDTSSQHISVSDIDNSFNSNEIINSYGAAMTDGSSEEITNLGAGNTWTVGTGTGYNFASLSAALQSNQVTAGDTIIIAPGTYTVTGLTVSKSVNIRAQSEDQPTIFSGNNNAMLTVSANNVNITGISFSNARPNNRNGGAIVWNGDNGTVDGCVFYDTYVGTRFGAFDTHNGGAIYWAGASGTVKNSVFYNNNASGSGGAIYWNGANGKLLNTTFRDNHAIRTQIWISVTTRGGLFIGWC